MDISLRVCIVERDKSGWVPPQTKMKSCCYVIGASTSPGKEMGTVGKCGYFSRKAHNLWIILIFQ